MKTLIFILLKIGEICLIPITYLLMAYLGYLINPFISRITGYELILNHDWYYASNFFLIFILIVYLIMSIYLIYLIYLLLNDLPKKWIKLNKKLTEKIYKKFKK